MKTFRFVAVVCSLFAAGSAFAGNTPVTVYGVVSTTGSCTVNDPTITTQKLAVDPNGRIGVNVNNFPGLALDATLTGGSQKTQIADASGHVADVIAGSTAATATSPAVAVALSPNSPLPAGTNAIGTVNGPTLTKGTQGTTGFAVQQLKDAGRVIRTFTATNFTAATTEALVTLTPASDGTTSTTGTSFTVTAGKRLRLTNLYCLTKNAGAAVQNVTVRVRMNPSGTVTATSPILATCGAATTAATAGVLTSNATPIYDGIELSGTMQVGISQIGTATAGNDVVLVGYEY